VIQRINIPIYASTELNIFADFTHACEYCYT
jgi:hypothetical protein